MTTLKDIKPISLRVFIERQANGQYSVYAPDLPGCCSQGDSVSECMHNIKDAAIGCIEDYIERWRKGETDVMIPWVPVDEREHCPDFCEERRVTL